MGAVDRIGLLERSGALVESQERERTARVEEGPARVVHGIRIRPVAAIRGQECPPRGAGRAGRLEQLAGEEPRFGTAPGSQGPEQLSPPRPCPEDQAGLVESEDLGERGGIDGSGDRGDGFGQSRDSSAGRVYWWGRANLAFAVTIAAFALVALVTGRKAREDGSATRATGRAMDS